MAVDLEVWPESQRRGWNERQALSCGVVRTLGRGQILGGVARVWGRV